MNPKITYIDSGVLINAFRGKSDLGLRAINILDDNNRSFASSPFVRLETLPKAIYQGQQTEEDFYQTFFSVVSHWAKDLTIIIPNAQTIASRYGIAGMDAIHMPLRSRSQKKSWSPLKSPQNRCFASLRFR